MFVSITSAHCFFEVSKKGLCGLIAALLTRISMLPNLFMPAFTTASASSSEAMFPIATIASTPNLRTSEATVSAALSLVLPLTIILIPASASSWAMPRPIFWPEPVIRAVLLIFS